MADAKTIDPDRIDSAMRSLVDALAARHATTPRLMVLGIAHGGVALGRWLAEQLTRRLGRAVPCGALDVSFHRDDLGQNPIPEVSPTVIPGDLTGATVILVDEVLFSGRTTRAALDELFDHGRPARVELAVLVDRGHRRLPVAADYVGLRLETTETEKVQVKFGFGPRKRHRISILPG